MESFTSNKSFLSDCSLESLVDSGLSLETDLRAFVFRCLNGELDDLSPQSHQCLTIMEGSTSFICLTLEDNKLYKTAFPTSIIIGRITEVCALRLYYLIVSSLFVIIVSAAISIDINLIDVKIERCTSTLGFIFSFYT